MIILLPLGYLKVRPVYSLGSSQSLPFSLQAVTSCKTDLIQEGTTSSRLVPAPIPAFYGYPSFFQYNATFEKLTSSQSGIKHKVENKQQYEEYLVELKGLREELGVNLKEDLYPEGTDSPFYNP